MFARACYDASRENLVGKAGTFGQLLRQHRVARGLTQAELAQRAHLSERGISDLERGIKRSPRLTTTRLLIAALALDDDTATHLREAAGLSASPVLNNIPRRLSSFVGRERYLADLRDQLGRSPLVTLVGPGGVGKSRVAVELGRAVLDQFPDGVWVVELAALRSGKLVARAVLDAIGLAEQPGRPSPEVLREALRTRRMLLVLDNSDDVDGVLALFADDVSYEVRPAALVNGQSVFSGKSAVQPLLAAVVAQHTRGELLGPPQVSGERVTLRIRVTADNFRRLGLDSLDEVAELVVRDGKIVSGIHTYTPESVQRLEAARAAATSGAPVQLPSALPRTGSAEPSPPYGILAAGTGILLGGAGWILARFAARGQRRRS